MFIARISISVFPAHLLPLQEGDAGLVCVPPLLEVLHHHGGGGASEAAHGGRDGQVPGAQDGEVQHAVPLLHHVQRLLKLHAGN